MIDRSYLPFESARLYQDRKMAKWMGFFLSEHTAALSDDLKKVTYLSSLTLEKNKFIYFLCHICDSYSKNYSSTNYS